jgi:hypothetical protein
VSRTPTIRAHTQDSRCYTRVLISREAYKQVKLLALEYDLTPSQVLEKIINDETRMARVREWAAKVQRGELHLG